MAKKKAKGGKKGGKKAAPPAAKMPMSWDNIFGEKGLSGLLAGLQKIKSADDIYINSRDNDLANENVKLKLMERFQRDDPLFLDFLLKKTQTRTGKMYKDPRNIAVELNTGADNFLDPEGPDGFPGGLKGEAYEQAMAYVELFNFMEEAHFVHLNPSFEKYGDDAQQQYMNALRKENHTEKRKMRDVKFERKQNESLAIKDRIKKGMMGDPEGESQAEKDGLIAWFQRGLDGGAIKADEEQSYRVWAKNTVAGSKNNLERFFAEKFLTMLNQKGQRAADKKKKLAEEAEAKKAAKKAAEEPPAGPAEDPPAGGPPDDDDDDDDDEPQTELIIKLQKSMERFVSKLDDTSVLYKNTKYNGKEYPNKIGHNTDQDCGFYKNGIELFIHKSNLIVKTYTVNDGIVVDDIVAKINPNGKLLYFTINYFGLGKCEKLDDGAYEHLSGYLDEVKIDELKMKELKLK